MNSVGMRALLHPRYHAPGSVRSDFAPAGDRNASAAEGEWVRCVAEAYVDSFRGGLLESYRWADLAARVHVDRSRYRVHVDVRALPSSAAARFDGGLRSLLISRWNFALTLATANGTAKWCSLTAPVTRLWREWPGAVTMPSLSTELIPSDGPVMVIARTRCGTLVRAVDGTAGWITDAVAERLRAVRPMKIRRNAWSSVARAFVGVPYKSGGTTPDGFDCSGLTQRIYREVSAVIIPRHSSDQHALRLWKRDEPHEGQLAFIDRPDGGVHVGVVIRNAHYRWSVVHASSTRAAVVEDPLELYAVRGE